MKKFIFLILFYNVTSFAQNINLGFDLEIHQIRISSPTHRGILGGEGAPLSYHLNLALDITEKLTFLAKGGKILHVEFSGWELGFNAAYKIYELLYIKAGVLHHSNEGSGGSNTFNVSYASILMIHFGVGVDIADFLSIGLDYYIPTSKKVIVWRGLFDKEPQTFEKMIRLAFNIGWDI